MVQITEGTFSIDDATLYTKTWLPDGPIKAKMIMFHGFSDHVNRYYSFFPYLAERGIAVYGVDQRGWGRSVKKDSDKGKTGPTTRVLADMAAFIRTQLPSDVPVFVLGHSMGGGQVLTLASTPVYEDLIKQIRGWILESPFVGFAPELQPSWLLVASGRLASHVVPHFKLHRPIPPEDVTRDPEVQASIRADDLMHDYGTLEGLAHMLDRTDGLSTGKLVISSNVKSLFMVHGTADKATSFDKSKEWFEQNKNRIPDAEFKAFEGFAHQLHADPGKEQFYEDVAAWILGRSPDEPKLTVDSHL
ncbi:alpha/beta hydrolase [Xylaria bambusicola]|uniref:alpha/beta hydrolase n=1 Tax=Xylaria bambusicola TaxID=326684 RepID=UPI002007725A|nr:alpha/beta hydrolase [Xylaria bambusicola]KAI0515364.1 alpha/beta hydrolase [Xylaria bambusicola]